MKTLFLVCESITLKISKNNMKKEFTKTQSMGKIAPPLYRNKAINKCV